ncbi:keratin, type I cytoskeletal 9 [Zeugodacus cucurbitae]|uniref:keratin, type I cytoskeletal 9 n=1 Tax=Zeugodacus cucurbitae TaxID=28588 RepID=UPI0023D90F60|nr:keratin, type I cytoskeletal 9 [Zeugodacus cucurbitae]XP_011179774.2 keratin, type I cytoskeletal 9 [Zeugodacus cucurbitae]
MHKEQVILIISAALICVAFAEREDDRWVWTRRSNDKYQPRPFHDSSAKYQGETLIRNARARNREPTTRKPLPGHPPNDEIEDYDDDVNTNVATRNYPYPPFGGQLFGTNYPYPNIGGGFGGATGNGNGILVGPGGPTGVIGRPQPAYPGGYNGQPGVGFPAQPGVFGGGNALGAGGQFGQAGAGAYAGIDAGLTPGFGGQFGGVGQFAGGQAGQYPVGGQYPIGGQYPGGAQYPGAQFQGNQFPSAQYPGAGGPQYTEGYGLASAGYPGYLQYNAGSPFGYGNAFNDGKSANRKLQVEGKNVEIVESSRLSQQQVDDKINKGLTNVQH